MFMSCGPTGPRKKVNGKTSPGAPMNSASPIRQAAALDLIDVPAVCPPGAVGPFSALWRPGPEAVRSANTPLSAANLNSVLATGTQMLTVSAHIVLVPDQELCRSALVTAPARSSPSALVSL